LKTVGFEEENGSLDELLRCARPEPDSAFSNAVSSALASLPNGTRSGTRFSKPLIVAAVILLSILLGLGAAYASGAFKDIFSTALSNVGDRKEQHDAEYDDLREQMEHMDEDAAAELDNELDYQSEKDNYDYTAMIGAAQHAVAISQEDSSLVLSEFSAVALEDYEPGWQWDIYLGFSAPEGYEYVPRLSMVIDGMEFVGWKTDLPAAAEEGLTNPVIYRCWTHLDRSALPETSLISVEIDGRSFCFMFDWKEESFVLPESGAQKTEWLEANRALTESFSRLNVKTGTVTGSDVKRGIGVRVKDPHIEGNKLILHLSITVPESMADARLCIYDVCLIIGGTIWDWGMLDFDHSPDNTSFDFTRDNPEYSLAELTLPLSPNALKNSEIEFVLIIEDMDAPALASDEDVFTRFEFSLRITE